VGQRVEWNWNIGWEGLKRGGSASVREKGERLYCTPDYMGVVKGMDEKGRRVTHVKLMGRVGNRKGRMGLRCWKRSWAWPIYKGKEAKPEVKMVCHRRRRVARGV